MNNKKYEELMEINPNYKMGFKILDEAQLLNILPTFKSMFNKFETYRKHIKIHKEYVQKDMLDIQYNLMFDNIFSIFGRRGSGKTSAIFTLREFLKNDKNSQDLVLPVIIPEVIPEECDVMEWILAILEDEIEKIERRIESQPKPFIDDDFFKNYKFIKNNKLRATFNDAKTVYFESRKMEHYNTDSLSASIDRKKRKTQSTYEFAKKFSNFLKVLCKTLKEDKEEEPLLYIMFDDVDLTPKIVKELLSTIIKYLAYPNIIVIITADEQLFERVVYQNIIKEYYNSSMTLNNMYIENLWDEVNFSKNLKSFFDYNQKCNGENIQSMTNSYINKILPPSSRYYIHRFEKCIEKAKFIQKVENKSEITVEQFLREKVNDYLNNNKYKNFLYYDGKKDQFIKIYLLFFGKKSRQIANECLIVEEFLSQLKKEKKQEMQVFYQIQNFVRNTLKNVKTILGNNDVDILNEFLEQVLYFEKENWKYYIDYIYIVNYYQKQLNERKEDKVQIIKNMISMFQLFFFIENVIKTKKLDKDNRIHGQKTLIRALDDFTTNGSLLRLEQGNDGISKFLYTYNDILEDPKLLQNFNIYDYKYVRQYLNLYKNNTDEVNKQEMENWGENHPKWFKVIIQCITLAYSGVYCINKKRVFFYTEIERLDFIGSDRQKLLNDTKNKILKAIKGRIKSGNDRNSDNKEIQGKIEEDIKELASMINNKENYYISKKDKTKLQQLLKKLKEKYEFGYKIMHLCEKVLEQIKENKDQKNTKYIKIKKSLLDQLNKELVKLYNGIQNEISNSYYYQNRVEISMQSLIDVMLLLEEKIDLQDENIKKYISENPTFKKRINEYYIGVINLCKSNKIPESFYDFEENKFGNKIYKCIQKIYKKKEPEKSLFEKYVCDIVNEVIDEYIINIIDKK